MEQQNKKKSFFSTSIKIKEEEKIPVMVLLAAIVAFVAVYFFLMPVASAYRANRLELENLSIDKSVLQEKQTKLQNLEKTIKEKQVFINQTKEVLPQDPQIAEALLMISKLATDNNLFINNFTPKIVDDTPIPGQTGVVKTDYKRVALQIDITGSYPNLKEFLKKLEVNIRPVNISNISIKGGGNIKAGASEVLRFNISGYIYYQ
ncbi:MAG TPA: type 4a pilus biogenesis protein PilO [Patescibacteria group bacterium]|nr:type 4a pilus biogenesis protein PilO [Patescibacteria group bacterium]